MESHDTRAFFALCVRQKITPQWSLDAEWLYVPLSVERESGEGSERDGLGSLRLQLRWQPD